MNYVEGKLARWRPRLQESDFDVMYRPGILNRAVDALWRLDSDATEPAELNDEIPTLSVIASNLDR